MASGPSKAAEAAWAKAHAILREKMGTDGAIAEALGISRQAMFKWKAVPPLQVPQVSKLARVKGYELRPDLPNLFKPPARRA